MSVTSRILGRVLGPVSDARAPVVLIRTTATRLHAAEQELFHDPDHHSAIVLPTAEPVPEP